MCICKKKERSGLDEEVYGMVRDTEHRGFHWFWERFEALYQTLSVVSGSDRMHPPIDSHKWNLVDLGLTFLRTLSESLLGSVPPWCGD